MTRTFRIAPGAPGRAPSRSILGVEHTVAARQVIEEKMARQLSTAHRTSQRVRHAVLTATFQIGWALVCLAVFPALLFAARLWPAAAPHAFYSMPLLAPGLVVLLLGLMPDESLAVRVACVALVLGLASLAMLTLELTGAFSAGVNAGSAPTAVAAIVFFLPPLALAPLLTGGSRVWSTRASLQRLWATGRAVLGASAAALLVQCVVDAAQSTEQGFRVTMEDRPGRVPLPASLTTAIVWLLVVAICHENNRGRVHRYLCSLGTRGEARNAAVVAALVGGKSVEEALSLARANFKALPFGELRARDFASSVDSGLAAKAVPMQLGVVDAFVSHSWHDDGADKFAAIAKWAAAKTKASGKEPTLWLDKACIDQANIDDSLAALPIYLAGCQELLVLVGATYISRLWCVMELFVWLQMGGSLDRITVLRLPEKRGFDRKTYFTRSLHHSSTQKGESRGLNLSALIFSSAKRRSRRAASSRYASSSSLGSRSIGSFVGSGIFPVKLQRTPSSISRHSFRWALRTGRIEPEKAAGLRTGTAARWKMAGTQVDTLLRDRNAAVRLQTAFRASTARRELKRARTGAIDMQRGVRGLQGRKRLKEALTAARLIQAAAREHQAYTRRVGTFGGSAGTGRRTSLDGATRRSSLDDGGADGGAASHPLRSNFWRTIIELAKFDARRAQCSSDNDRQKLLAAVESTFGDVQPFNHLVRHIFVERGYTEEPSGGAETEGEARGDGGERRSSRAFINAANVPIWLGRAKRAVACSRRSSAVAPAPAPTPAADTTEVLPLAAAGGDQEAAPLAEAEGLVVHDLEGAMVEEQGAA